MVCSFIKTELNNISVTQQLGWTAASGAISYNIYLGTTNPPLFKTTITDTSYSPGTLAYNTTYYWRIDAQNSSGTTFGNLWRFKTLMKGLGVAGSQYSTLALKVDGTLWGCGYNEYGELGIGHMEWVRLLTQIGPDIQLEPVDNWSTIAMGQNHTLALKTDGTLWASGYNNNGQLGDGTPESKSAFIQIGNESDWSTIAAGGNHSLALKSDGTLWAWGLNDNGQLGDGTNDNKSTPVYVRDTGGVTLTNITAIACGMNHTIALKSNGTVWAWGYNDYGQLGDGTYATTNTPVAALGLTGVTTIAGGNCHSLALKSDGTVWAWGLNDNGQLGDGTYATTNTPVAALGLTNVMAIGAGSTHSLALKTNGTVWAWGNNGSGQLGDGTTVTTNTPVAVSGLTNVIAIGAGGSYSLALKSDGTLWAWGYNNYGQIGQPPFSQELTPAPVVNLSNIVAMARGIGKHSLALKSDGTVWSWGLNDNGQLGNGTTTNYSSPLQVPGLTNVITIGIGPYHSLAIKTDGTVWGWGDNDSWQLGSYYNDKYIPVRIFEK